MAAASWAKRRAGGSSSGSSASASSAASPADAASSVSSASDEGYQDDKFHLPVEHRPFILLPGWDQPPQPPPSLSGSSSSSGGSSGSGESGGSDSEAPGGSESGSSSGSDSGSESADPNEPVALPPPVGFSCATCRFFKAQGNGMFGCEQEDYQRWSGTDKLVESKSGRPVLNPQMAASDWYEPATGETAKPVPTRHNQ